VTTAAVSRLVTAPAWLWLGVPGLLAAVIYAPLIPDLVREWASFSNLSHGFAIPVIAAYLVWSRRERLRATRIAPCWLGLPILLLGLVGLVVGVHGEESFIARMSLPVTLLGLVLLLAGREVSREVWVAIAYLVFMIPPPFTTLKLVTYRSRVLDADVSTYLLRWLGVPIHQDGVLLHLPNITLEVADACSSIPALAALVSLGIAYAALVRRSVVTRTIFIMATVPLAIGANIIRITTTAAAVYYLGPWTLRSVYHQFNGTVNFLLTFALLMLLDTALVAISRARAR
jgi:exosortase